MKEASPLYKKLSEHEKAGYVNLAKGALSLPPLLSHRGTHAADNRLKSSVYRPQAAGQASSALYDNAALYTAPEENETASNPQTSKALEV